MFQVQLPLYVTEMEDIRTLKAVFLNELQVKKKRGRGAPTNLQRP